MESLKANEMMMKTMTKPPLSPAYNAKSPSVDEKGKANE
jgi:hypothetical protein